MLQLTTLTTIRHALGIPAVDTRVANAMDVQTAVARLTSNNLPVQLLCSGNTTTSSMFHPHAALCS